jgi:glucose-6-phosphate isomerase
LLEIDPFNQPNVAEAKDRTAVILDQISSGKQQALLPVYEDSEIEIYSSTGVKTLTEFLQTSVKYFAVMAYLSRGSENEIVKIRALIAKRTNKPTTFGWGPRFLHSTGQFHKGGQPNGGFIQITAVSDVDIEIPNKPYTFSQLILAQALGDAQALTERKLPLLRIHLKNRSTGINKLISEF